MEPKRFATREECSAFIDVHGILAFPHATGRCWIAVCSLPQGMFAAVSATEAVRLEGW